MKKRNDKGQWTYFASSYGPYGGDPLGTYVSLVPGVAEAAADLAAERAEEEFLRLLGAHFPIEVTDEFSWVDGRDLFTAAELREVRHALLAGEAVHVGRIH